MLLLEYVTSEQSMRAYMQMRWRIDDKSVVYVQYLQGRIVVQHLYASILSTVRWCKVCVSFSGNTLEKVQFERRMWFGWFVPIHTADSFWVSEYDQWSIYQVFVQPTKLSCIALAVHNSTDSMQDTSRFEQDAHVVLSCCYFSGVWNLFYTLVHSIRNTYLSYKGMMSSWCSQVYKSNFVYLRDSTIQVGELHKLKSLKDVLIHA